MSAMHRYTIETHGISTTVHASSPDEAAAKYALGNPPFVGVTSAQALRERCATYGCGGRMSDESGELWRVAPR